MRQQWADYRVFWREFRATFETTGAVLPSGWRLSNALAHYVHNCEPAAEKGDRHLLCEAPSGPFRQKVPVPFFGGRRILEVGPGTGAVTQHIVRAMRDGDRLVLVERNAEFVARLQERLAEDATFQNHLRKGGQAHFAPQTPQNEPVPGDVERISLRHAGVEELAEDEKFDVIVSGLPLNNFSAALVETILAKLDRLLAPGGTLSFFEYIAIRRVKGALSRQATRVRLREIGRLLGEFLDGREIRRDAVWLNVPPAWVHHLRR